MTLTTGAQKYVGAIVGGVFCRLVLIASVALIIYALLLHHKHKLHQVNQVPFASAAAAAAAAAAATDALSIPQPHPLMLFAVQPAVLSLAIPPKVYFLVKYLQ